MSGPAHPPPVLRFLHRPLWWALGVAVFVLLLFGLHAREVRADQSLFGDAVVLPAIASRADPDTDIVDLEYLQEASAKAKQGSPPQVPVYAAEMTMSGRGCGN